MNIIFIIYQIGIMIQYPLSCLPNIYAFSLGQYSLDPLGLDIVKPQSKKNILTVTVWFN